MDCVIQNGPSFANHNGLSFWFFIFRFLSIIKIKKKFIWENSNWRPDKNSKLDLTVKSWANCVIQTFRQKLQTIKKNHRNGKNLLKLWSWKTHALVSVKFDGKLRAFDCCTWKGSKVDFVLSFCLTFLICIFILHRFKQNFWWFKTIWSLKLHEPFFGFHYNVPVFHSKRFDSKIKASFEIQWNISISMSPRDEKKSIFYFGSNRNKRQTNW